jgi:Adaptin N terminal region
MQTDNLELKKLVYLYLINYAKTQPDLAILAVNTFVKVSLRHPLIDRFDRSFIYCFLYRTAMILIL